MLLAIPLLRRARASESPSGASEPLPLASAARSGLLPLNCADTERMARLGRGDRTALAELYDVHAPRVLALLRSILKDRAEADDLLHDVFLQVWRNARDFDPERGKVVGWLLTMARSRAIDRLRSIPRSRTVTLETVTLEGANEGPGASSFEEHVMSEQQLPELWAALNPEERQVLYLGYFEDLTCAEMAQKLAVPVGTIKSRTRTALQKMRSKSEASK
jgi:RNA polymerase sigma-70 factor, ECF subfamily